MFPPTPTTKLAQRALGALRVARSLLLLEDDYEVDWVLARDERTRVPHPHRAPLRGGCAQRRAGQVPARAQACLSPVSRDHYKRHAARERRTETALAPVKHTDACGPGARMHPDR